VFVVYFAAAARWIPALCPRPGARLKGGGAAVDRPRDEARAAGGIGPCGRDLCCATFLKDFEPVSVRDAKDQDLPVNRCGSRGRAGG